MIYEGLDKEDLPMNILDIIRQRRSTRTFDGNNLRPEDAQKIIDFAEKLENPYDLAITWKLLDAEKYGLSSPVIVGTDLYIAGKMRRLPYAEDRSGHRTLPFRNGSKRMRSGCLLRTQ